MSIKEKAFWVVLTAFGAIFGTGLYLFFGPEPTRSALLLMIVGVIGMLATFVENSSQLSESRSLLVIALLALGLNLGVLAYDIYDRHENVHDYPVMQARWFGSLSALPTTSGEDLTDKLVRLDGRRFEDCTIGGGTTLLYEGEKPFVLNCKQVKSNGRMVQIASDNPAIQQIFALTHNFEVWTGGKVPICQTPESLPGLVPGVLGDIETQK